MLSLLSNVNQKHPHSVILKYGSNATYHHKIDIKNQIAIIKRWIAISIAYI